MGSILVSTEITNSNKQTYPLVPNEEIHSRSNSNTKSIKRTSSFSVSDFETENRKITLQDFTPDEPCHRHADSLISLSSGYNNFRGFLNCALILLVMANGHSVIENFLKYGLLIDPIYLFGSFIVTSGNSTAFSLFYLNGLFAFISLLIEKQAVKGRLSENMIHILHLISFMIQIVFPACLIVYVHPNPIISSFMLILNLTVLLKLISYKQVNYWCRSALINEKNNQRRKNNTKDKKNSKNEENETIPTNDKENNVIRRLSVSKRERCYSHSDISDDIIESLKNVKDDLNATNAKKDNQRQHYPNNLRLKDILYFLFAPTLCYELNFPRTTRIRKTFVIKRFIEIIFLFCLILSVFQQWIEPLLKNSIEPMKNKRIGPILNRLFKLIVPANLLWLVCFYVSFHSFLNLIAELLRFGDRIFYKDWWNSENLRQFWILWNIPVHKWASRHIYRPLLKSGYSPLFSFTMVFFVSGLLHEYLVSVPLKSLNILSFLGMFLQAPIILTTSGYLNSRLGNISVWLTLMIGQSLAILIYYSNYYLTYISTNIDARNSN